MEKQTKSCIQSIICSLFIFALFFTIFVNSSRAQVPANFINQNVLKDANGAFNEAPDWRQLQENININRNAAVDSNVTLIGRWANGPCFAVGVAGSTAYIGNGGYFQILDITDLSNPILLSKIVLPSLVYDIAISGNYAYVANGDDGLRIIDVSDPAAPTEVGFFDTGSEAKGVYLNNDYAYVADGGDGRSEERRVGKECRSRWSPYH